MKITTLVIVVALAGCASSTLGKSLNAGVAVSGVFDELGERVKGAIAKAEGRS